MNKDQRKYLTDWVLTGFNREQKSIEDRRTKRPSLNNHLVAAALDGSLGVNGPEQIVDHVRKTVLRMGKEDVLVRWRDADRYERDTLYRNTFTVTLPADVVFQIPEAYLAELRAWEENEAGIKRDLAALAGVKETVLLKVNIGSDKALESVIEQADTLATLDLVNRQLTANTQKLIEDKTGK